MKRNYFDEQNVTTLETGEYTLVLSPMGLAIKDGDHTVILSKETLLEVCSELFLNSYASVDEFTPYVHANDRGQLIRDPEDLSRGLIQ